ncbi:hypothetical protein D9M68_505650 [compost metagenome]
MIGSPTVLVAKRSKSALLIILLGIAGKLIGAVPFITVKGCEAVAAAKLTSPGWVAVMVVVPIPVRRTKLFSMTATAGLLLV